MASSRELNFATNYEARRMLENKKKIVYSPVHKSAGQRSTRQTFKAAICHDIENLIN